MSCNSGWSLPASQLGRLGDMPSEMQANLQNSTGNTTQDLVLVLAARSPFGLPRNLPMLYMLQHPVVISAEAVGTGAGLANTTAVAAAATSYKVQVRDWLAFCWKQSSNCTALQLETRHQNMTAFSQQVAAVLGSPIAERLKASAPAQLLTSEMTMQEDRATAAVAAVPDPAAVCAAVSQSWLSVVSIGCYTVEECRKGTAVQATSSSLQSK